MNDHLRVDPVRVHLAGDEVDEHAANLLAGHMAANERIAAAQGGFIGDSAAALAEPAAHWKEETASHHRELSEHAENLRAAAASYDTTDTDAGATINAAVSDVARRMGI
ncbi:WXG100 family type VII secretion target [Mycobacterium shimoidei]|uniref:Uncharacterized protein n=1 Tax=Mycobacterium shimoidei TaxID=29313 RepID=A0A1E3TI98_MYCSH|nr:type VII secretion target [Mycobacterium shimoidei]MCV7257892.1 WXG100 family type VII secretion target [Mycobacterium shimoidei]ODR14164.1 hypothetical protein BHQ16_06940 [Mycobacterium shimoidei]ORW83940.1 hypothetical protein AWC26_00530 [Mycobacterium shimoidei]SRX91869.1 hypothetical protein MSP7336_00090 [Mycobacterium shimoidei]